MNGQSAKIGFLEPFFSGSHRGFALGWKAHSRHEVEVYGLPGRFWKWRMRAAALEFARQARGLSCQPDLWFATSLMDVAHFAALLGPKRPPVALYFHECQASYPLRDGVELPERDYQYLMTDLAGAGMADAVFFNSAALMLDFFTHTETFLRRMPDARPLWLLDDIREKARVLHLGVDYSGLEAGREEGGGPLRILWPHRWEHDKNPEEFFGVMEELDRRGLEFRLLVAGGAFGRVPAVFNRARESLAHRIDHWGEVRERGEYGRLLACADVVVSTAFHETFGVSVVEAAWAGAHPLVPERLSYPEVVPPQLHGACVYRGAQELTERLAGLLTGARERVAPTKLREVFDRYSWTSRAEDFDRSATEILQKRDNML